jgi:protein involved in polysaccharide export with SLBB domain
MKLHIKLLTSLILSKIVLLFLIIVPITFLLGCQVTTLPKPVPPSMLLRPGDEIEIRFAYLDPEQFNVTQTIRPDGKIDMLIIGEITAEGKTPSELRDELIKLYTPHLQHPKIAVVVRSFRGRRVYVGGEVMRPGYIDMPGPMTALEAIMEVGGYREETADIERIIIVRHNDGKRFSYALSIKKSLEGNGQEAETFYLSPRDIVVVPQTTIVNIDQWVDQYIRQMIPLPMSSETFVAPQAPQ